MEAKELMINDWVMHNDGTPMQVSVIKKDCFACSSQPYLYDYNNEFKPILLTPKMLKANGFVDDKAFECYYVVNKKKKDNVFFIEYYNRYLAVRISGTEVKLKYVHKLQQALRLRGLDDIANNFKIG